jgi:hypothetical protein
MKGMSAAGRGGHGDGDSCETALFAAGAGEALKGLRGIAVLLITVWP